MVWHNPEGSGAARLYPYQFTEVESLRKLQEQFCSPEIDLLCDGIQEPTGIADLCPCLKLTWSKTQSIRSEVQRAYADPAVCSEDFKRWYECRKVYNDIEIYIRISPLSWLRTRVYILSPILDILTSTMLPSSKFNRVGQIQASAPLHLSGSCILHALLQSNGLRILLNAHVDAHAAFWRVYQISRIYRRKNNVLFPDG